MVEADEIPKSKEPPTHATNLLPGIGNSEGQPFLVASGVRLSSGRLILLQGKMIATNLHAISEMLGIPLSGIIGFDLIKAHLAELDFIDNELRIYPAGSQIKPFDNTTISLNIRPLSNFPIFTGMINLESKSAYQASIMMDTGSQMSLLIMKHGAQFLSLTSGSDWKKIPMSGIGGNTTVSIGPGALIEVSNRHIEVNSTAIDLDDTPLDKIGEFDAVIGLGVLKHKVLTFDVESARILITQ